MVLAPEQKTKQNKKLSPAIIAADCWLANFPDDFKSFTTYDKNEEVLAASPQLQHPQHCWGPEVTKYKYLVTVLFQFFFSRFLYLLCLLSISFSDNFYSTFVDKYLYFLLSNMRVTFVLKSVLSNVICCCEKWSYLNSTVLLWSIKVDHILEGNYCTLFFSTFGFGLTYYQWTYCFIFGKKNFYCLL